LDLPDKTILNKITLKHLYLDKKSKEQATNIMKRKYKLAGNSLSDIGMYFFYVLTKSPGTGKAKFTLAIKQTDWEEKIVGPYLTEPASYCDLTKFELLGPSDLLGKFRDKDNGFPYIAKLCEMKYKELIKIQSKIIKYPLISRDTKAIINRGMAETIDQIASKLGIE
jgi:hypothetical protein